MSGARGTPAALTAIFIAMSGYVPQAAPEPRADRRLPVRLCDKVHAPSKVTAASVALTTRIYATTGVRLDWTTSCEAGGFSVTLGDEGEVPAIFTSDTVGFAAPGTTDAAVIYARVARLAHDFHARLPLLLGYVIAHELGHLLLPPHSHSPTGVMTGTFNPLLFDTHELRFDPQQAAQLRVAIANYTAAAVPQNAFDAMRAPSAIAASLPQTTSGSTAAWPTQVP